MKLGVFVGVASILIFGIHQQPARAGGLDILLGISQGLAQISQDYQNSQGSASVDDSGVAVFADSISCVEVARKVLSKLRLHSVPLRQADSIIVVVRSELNDPLRLSYESVSDLMCDSKMQLNISGSICSVYRFSINEDLSSRQLGHIGFKYSQ